MTWLYGMTWQVVLLYGIIWTPYYGVVLWTMDWYGEGQGERAGDGNHGMVWYGVVWYGMVWWQPVHNTRNLLQNLHHLQKVVYEFKNKVTPC